MPLSAGLGAKVTVAGSPVNSPGPETVDSRAMDRCLRFTGIVRPSLFCPKQGWETDDYSNLNRISEGFGAIRSYQSLHDLQQKIRFTQVPRQDLQMFSTHLQYLAPFNRRG